MNDDLRALDALEAIAREHGLDALTVRHDGTTYEIVLRPEAPLTTVVTAAEASVAPAALTPAAPRPAVAASNVKKIVAPIIGVFYRSPAPGAAAFVEPGDRVEVGQVVCILEAMKLMNEITSDHAGIVRRVLPENGALVSLGEEMLWIEPQ